MSEEQDKDFVIAGLVESNNILQSEVAQVRRSNRILRTVNSALRKSIDSLRRTHELAVQNDEMFKRFCNGDFDVPSTQLDESGLLEPGSQVEALVMNNDKASAPTATDPRDKD